VTALLFKLVGGIGLFLLGMALLTDGLKSFAGDALRRALVRFTGTPLKAFVSGALVTTLVQSSSATTVTVIGFVSAGMLTFPQSVGVVMGASLGTTATGWIVAVLGLKISLGFYALPLVGAGAFMKLLARGRWKAFGLALAGFGLIFIGIETLQEAMQGLSGVFNLARLPPSGLLGHAMAMGIGIALTIIMQSSSAAVATTLTALHTGTVNFEQAASLVIGAAIGTTVTGALAAIGGSVPAKRTALAHVLFNLCSGLLAVVLLPVFLGGIRLAQERLGLDPGATSLAAFHTAFIATGVLIFLPLVNRFSRRIELLLPETGPPLTRHLDATVLNTPAVALEATRRALSETAGELFRVARVVSRHAPGEAEELRLQQTDQSLTRIQEFFAKIPPLAEDLPLAQQRAAQMHAIDHLLRLHSRLHPPPAVQRMLADPRLQPMRDQFAALIELGQSALHGRAAADWPAQLEQMAFALADLRRHARPTILLKSSGGETGPGATLAALDAMRWLDRLGYHTWRICNYVAGEGTPEPAASPGKTAPDE